MALVSMMSPTMGGGAVGVDVAQFVGADARHDHGAAHGLSGRLAALVRLGEVEGVAAHAVPQELRVDVSPARDGVLPLLQHHDGRPLTDDEAVAAGVEGTAGPLGLLVPGGEGPQGRERAQSDVAHRRLRTSGEHGHGVPAPYHMERVSQCVGAGRARRAGGVHRTADAERHGDVGGGHVGDHHGDEEGVDAVGAPLDEDLYLLVEDVQPSDP